MFRIILKRGYNNLYQTILQAVSEHWWIIFLGCTWWNRKNIHYYIDSGIYSITEKIALALASSGIAAPLLDGRRTAHSTLKLPLNMQVNETPT